MAECRTEGCGREATARGLCNPCYQRAYRARGGRPEARERRERAPRQPRAPRERRRGAADGTIRVRRTNRVNASTGGHVFEVTFPNGEIDYLVTPEGWSGTFEEEQARAEREAAAVWRNCQEIE